MNMHSNILIEKNILPYEHNVENNGVNSLVCGELLSSSSPPNHSEFIRYDILSIFLRQRNKVDESLLLTNLLRHEMYDITSSINDQSTTSWGGNRDLKMYMREIVVTWMHEVCSAENCDEEVFHLSCRYLDLLAKHQSRIVCKTNLQKFAAVAMLMASKLKQPMPLSLPILYGYTDYSVPIGDIRECEILALEMLNWGVNLVTPHSFLDSLIQINEIGENNQIRQHALTFIDLSAYYSEFIDIKPSVLACSALLSSLAGLKTKISNPTLLLSSLISCDENSLRQCQSSLERRFFEKSYETTSLYEKVKCYRGAFEARQTSHDPHLTPKNGFKTESSAGTPPNVADIMINNQGYAQQT